MFYEESDYKAVGDHEGLYRNLGQDSKGKGRNLLSEGKFCSADPLRGALVF